MSNETDRLQHLLDQSYREALAALEGIDIAPPRDGSAWVGDTVGQLLLWEAASLRALRQYAETQDVHPDMHETSLHERRKDTDAVRLYAAWEALRESMKTTIGDLPDARLNDELTLPDGERGTVSDLVQGLVAQQNAVLDQILRTITP